MKIKNLTCLLSVVCFFALTEASAERIFILYDASCMDRLEYEYGRTNYLAYHVNIRPGEKLVLEVGEEGSNEQNYIPTPNYNCGNGVFDQALMRRINANIDEVFIVYPKNDRRYIITPVAMAAFYGKAGPVITYESPKYSFRFNTEYGTIGENIAHNNPGVKLYFEGQIQNDCEGAFLFRQLAPQSAYPLIDLVLTPEIGITEERSGPNAAAAMDNALVLDKINGKSLERYLQEVCGTEPGEFRSQLTSANTAGPTSYDNTPQATMPRVGLPPGAQPIGAPGSTPVTTTARTPEATHTQPQQTQPTTHTVADGETLYGISRQYDLTVEQLKSWNNLNSNLIRRGQQLQVAPPNTNAPANVARQPAATVGGDLAARSPSMPVPYDNTSRRVAAEGESIHIARAGETVASLALKYGYTESRFREMNDLGPNDFIRVGQRLKTSDCPTTPSNTAAAQPSNYAATGGRITPSATYATEPARESNTMQARTPTAYSQPVMPSSAGTPITTSSPRLPNDNLQARSPDSYNTTSRSGTGRNVSPNDIYSAIIPKAYDNSASSQSMSSLEGNNRAIAPSNAASNTPVTTARGIPNSYDAPQSYGNTLPSRPDSYYRQNSNQRRVHIVQEGETLYTIARRYNTTPEQLRQINDMEANAVILPYQTVYLE